MVNTEEYNSPYEEQLPGPRNEKNAPIQKNGGRPPQRGSSRLGSGSAVAFFFRRLHGGPLLCYPAPPSPFVSSSFIAISKIHLLSGGMLIGGGGHHALNITSHYNPGPESFTSAAPPDFVGATPISVYVSAGGISIETRGISVMSKDWVPPAGPTTTARHPQRSHSVSTDTTAPRRGAAAIGTPVRPQRPCPRTLTAPCSVSAKFTPKCSLTSAQPPSSDSASARSARHEAG